MPKNIIGFNSEDDFDRMSRSVRKSENTPQVGQQQRAKYPVSASPVVKRGMVSQLGDYDVHLVTLLSGSFTEDLTTDGLNHTRLDVTAYIANEFDYHLNVGDIVILAKIAGQYWIIDAEPDCNGYCIDEEHDGNGYVFGWAFRAPNLPCCPEAGGIHVLETSDSGATYETSTFQCNSDGTDRKWLFKDRKLRLTPRLDEGNIEYSTDNPPASCTVQLQHYEPQRFPTRDAECGKMPSSVCLNPLCGIGSCSACEQLTIMEWEIDFGNGGTSNPYYLPTVYDYCDTPSGIIRAYQNFHRGSSDYCSWIAYTGGQAASISISTADPPVMLVRGPGDTWDSVQWTAEGPFDCDSKITLNVEYTGSPESRCIGYPDTITVRPVRGPHLEDNCYPTVIHGMPSAVGCTQIPYYAEIDLSGITDGTCSECTQLNAVTRLAIQFTQGPNYISDTISSSCLSASTTTPAFKVITDNGGDQYYLQFGGATAVYIKSGISTWSCTGPNTFTYSTDDGRCNNWPSTITVYPMVSTI